MERGRGTAAEGDRERQKGIRHRLRGSEGQIKRDRPNTRNSYTRQTVKGADRVAGRQK